MAFYSKATEPGWYVNTPGEVNELKIRYLLAIFVDHIYIRKINKFTDFAEEFDKRRFQLADFNVDVNGTLQKFVPGFEEGICAEIMADKIATNMNHVMSLT